jgi:hypothetical protein
MLNVDCANKEGEMCNSSMNPSPYLYLGKRWLFCNGEGVLWIPGDYRKLCFAVKDGILIMAGSSGQATVLELKLASIPIRTAVYSKPFVNTSVLQIPHAIGQ